MKKIILSGILITIFFMLNSLAYAHGNISNETEEVVTVTLNAPTGGQWISSFPVSLNFTPSGNTSANAGYNCSLFANFNGTWRRDWSGEPQVTSHNLSHLVPSTTYNFSIQSGLVENNSGYTWNVGCVNNLTGDMRENSNMSFGTNATFKLDVTAPTVPVISSPANGSSQGSRTPFIAWTTSGDVNFKQYTIQFANSSDFDTADVSKQQLILVNSTPNTTFTESLNGDTFYYLRILAEDEAGNTAWQFTNATIITSIPVITITHFANHTYKASATPKFNITVIHKFVDKCYLYLTNASNDTSLGLSWQGNESQWLRNITNASSSNGSIYFEPKTMKDGLYYFGFVCNNTGGNSSGFTQNRSLIIDTVAPADFACIIANSTKSIDHTPNFVFNVSNDLNFKHYSLFVDNDTDFSSPEYTSNNTAKLLSYFTANLRTYDDKDRNWYWKVNSTDLAGNSKETTNCSQRYYRTDVTNHLLKSGWNIVSIMQSGTINSSDLGIGFGASWTTISKYNVSSTAKTFQNYNNGSSTNENMSFRKGDVVFINVNADSYWENQTWDTDSSYTDVLFNLTNSSSGWNLFGVQNQSGFTLGRIDWGIRYSNRIGGGTYSYYYDFANVTLPNNESVQYLTYFNNTAVATKKYVTHPYNYTKNNDTFVDFGESVWININASINGTSNLMILNMSLILPS